MCRSRFCYNYAVVQVRSLSPFSTHCEDVEEQMMIEYSTGLGVLFKGHLSLGMLFRDLLLVRVFIF